MASAAQHVIQCDPATFRRDLNVLPYEIAHTLADNPLFQLPALVELAQRVAARTNPHMSGGDAYFTEGLIEAGTKPDYTGSAASPEQSRQSMADLITRIEHKEAWIILKHVEREPGYQEVLESAVSDVLQLSGRKDLLDKIKWFEAILFITSPNRVTEYHIDRECSWIMQIAGQKAIHLFDRADKDIVPEDELERFYTVDNRASQYKPQFEKRAMVYDMTPGTGVHIPVNTPHWLQNGPEVSVTLNINFQFKDAEVTNLYKANYYLRRAGLKPTQPGASPLADWAKSRAFTAAIALKRRLRKGDGIVPPEAREQKRRIAKLAAAAR